MADSLPIFDETDEVIGTLTVIERGDRKNIVFRSDDGLMIYMPNISKFLDYARNRKIPEEQINRALKFFHEHIVVY